MELQFEKKPVVCLRQLPVGVKSEEQTQEIKLSESMPDIGHVLGAWGQTTIRSKEWRSDSISVSGGVMAWVLYAPEDSGTPQGVACWIPFQLRWDLPETQSDGAIILSPFACAVDARAVSARKLMVRAQVGIHADAMEPVQLEVCTPGELPEDVQVKYCRYPLCVPSEAGEKAFFLDEELRFSASAKPAVKIIRCELRPEVIDKKVMAGKLVFRGSAVLHILYQCDDGQLQTCDFEIPFSQYQDLEHEYGPDTKGRIIFAVTSLETDIADADVIRLKAGIVAQYVIHDCSVVEIIEDAYSTCRNVELRTQVLEIPAVLEERTEMLTPEKTVDMNDGHVVDTYFSAGIYRQRRDDSKLRIEIPGTFQTLYYDSAENLRSDISRWDGEWEFVADIGADVRATVMPNGPAQAFFAGNGTELRAGINVDAVTVVSQGLPMVTAVEIGEERHPDPATPSLDCAG